MSTKNAPRREDCRAPDRWWQSKTARDPHAERGLRPLVLQRRVIQGSRPDQGSENHSVIRSLFEIARRQGKKVHRFLLDLLTQNTADAEPALYRKPLHDPPAPRLHT